MQFTVSWGDNCLPFEIVHSSKGAKSSFFSPNFSICKISCGFVVVVDSCIQLWEQKANYFSEVCIIIHSNRVLHHVDEEHHATMFVSEGKAFSCGYTLPYLSLYLGLTKGLKVTNLSSPEGIGRGSKAWTGLAHSSVVHRNTTQDPSLCEVFKKPLPLPTPSTTQVRTQALNCFLCTVPHNFRVSWFWLFE